MNTPGGKCENLNSSVYLLSVQKRTDSRPDTAVPGRFKWKSSLWPEVGSYDVGQGLTVARTVCTSAVVYTERLPFFRVSSIQIQHSKPGTGSQVPGRPWDHVSSELQQADDGDCPWRALLGEGACFPWASPLGPSPLLMCVLPQGVLSHPDCETVLGVPDDLELVGGGFGDHQTLLVFYH